ncbi:MAG: PAS domain-containing protein [Deltaproteobacteria bacterium]|nr:PAS domain-containing protein [Deltaproteobacteria bacterium]
MLHPADNPALLDALLAQAPGVLWTADPALRCRFIAGAAAARLGLPLGAPIADSPLAPAATPAALAAHQQALRGEPAEYAVAIAGVVFACRIEPLRDAGGAIAGVLGRAVPSDEQRLADAGRALLREQAARQRAERTLSDLVNNSSAAIYLKDLTGRYLLSSDRVSALFDATGTPVEARDDYAVMPAAQADMVRANDAQVLAAERSMQFEEVVVDGEGVERTYLSIKFPLRDRDGVVYGVCGISTDITERKRIESELRRSEATLVAVIESSSDPICAIDRNLHIIALNSVLRDHVTKVFGRTPDVGSARGLADPEFVARWTARFRRALEGERYDTEEELTIGDVTHHFLVALNPTVQDGQVTGVTVFGKDITELRRAEQEARLHHAELAHVLRLHTMGELTASLAHEVNQPLGAIANYAQGCRRRIEAGATASELLPTLNAIASEALRAGEITRRVRELLRKENSPHALADVTQIVQAAVEIAMPPARARHVTLRVVAAPALPAVRVDPIQVEQVVLNLLLNAIDACAAAADRSVEVRVAAAGAAAVEVAVHDRGSGIDPRVAPHVFEPFMTTKPNGLGMGLAISRSIVAAHGGELILESTAAGTLFRFTLPVAAAD